MQKNNITKWQAQASDGGFNYRHKYSPLFSGKYYLEKRYFGKDERLSWSHHSSFSIAGYECSLLVYLNNLYGYLAKCFGMEVIEAYSFFQGFQNQDLPSYFDESLESEGYYYGVSYRGELELLDHPIKSIVFIQNPISILYESFKDSNENDFARYVKETEHWNQFKRLLTHENGEKRMIVRVENLIKDPIDVVVDTMLFILGHEPFSLVRDALDIYLSSSIISSFTSGHYIEEVDGLQDVLSGDQKLVLNKLGYSVEGVLDIPSYSQEILQRTI